MFILVLKINKMIKFYFFIYTVYIFLIYYIKIIMNCLCDKKIPKSDPEIKNHLKTCAVYLKKSFFYNNLDRIPKNCNENDLNLIRVELQLIKDEIQNRISQLCDKMVIEEQENGPVDLQVIDSNIVECLNCRNKFYSNYDIKSLFYTEECWHLFCKPCIIKYIDKEFVNSNGNLKCLAKGCKTNIDGSSIRQLLGNAKFQILQEKSIKKQCNIVACFKCKAEYEFQEGNFKNVTCKDAQGKPLTQQMAKSYASNRFMCMNCKTQQCKQCHHSPYHVGKTCEEFKVISQSKKCRYCEEVMPNKNTKSGVKAFQDICNKKDCQDLMRTACSKIHGCGHPCKGISGEKNCLPCISQGCCQKNPDLLGQKGQDYCAICYIEALDVSPCIRSSCGHIFHLKCVSKRLEIRWLGPRILFNFCLCPLCKKWIQLPQQNALNRNMIDNANLFEKIKSKCVERLKFEGCDKDQKLVDPKSPYYQKPLEYALAIFSYYQCFKCKQPYFGGRKDCENAMAEGQGNFNQKQLICSNCCEIPVQNCPKHGKDYIQFKCKFCCTVAQWFCWGNTHFCDPCHQRQCKGDYISKYTKDKLPKCLGVGKCPVGGNHQGNGDQKPLGCAICRNIKESGKAF